MRKNITLFLCFVVANSAFSYKKFIVKPTIETLAVDSIDDAADDAAFLYNHQDPQQSFILGSDKKKGFNFYNLKGELISSENQFPINNIDTFSYDLEKRKYLIGGSVKQNASFVLFEFDFLTNSNRFISQSLTKSKEAYGFCLYRNPLTNKSYAFVTTKKGPIEQWEIVIEKSAVQTRYIRTINVFSQTEGCVTDHKKGYLYVAEEEFGIWRFQIDPKLDLDPTVVASIFSNDALSADLEGIALLEDKYLIVSVQNQNEFAIFETKPPFNHIGQFSIGGTSLVDSVEHTDGIDIISMGLGSQFPFGLFIAQDDKNLKLRNSNKSLAQNFKLISLEEILQQVE